MDIELNITNIKKRLTELDGENKRLMGMLEVLEGISSMGVKVIKKEEDDTDIEVAEEVIDGTD